MPRVQSRIILTVLLKLAVMAIAVSIAVGTYRNTSEYAWKIIIAEAVSALCVIYLILNVLQLCGMLLYRSVNRIIHGIDWIILVYISLYILRIL
ncbi:MAG: hypothetical protein KBS95_04075 [Alistipes sp.]|nr:hypothetical protein [Candidatus Alistipes equi]